MITAKIIQHSHSYGSRVDIVTFELEYPRFIHGELMTHRVFSRNAASSRAIPISKMIEQVRNNPAMPIHWGKNQAGMQATHEVDNKEAAELAWLFAAADAARNAEILDNHGVHKQVVNRLLEPFQTMKTVVTATDFENFFELRCHSDAQPEIRDLASKMREALRLSTPLKLGIGGWHVPYVDRFIDDHGTLRYYSNDVEITVEDAIKISASCCAQVSYRLLDDSLEKARSIYSKLVDSKPIHASPFEHQASAQMDNNYIRNFRGWKQHRTYIEANL